MTEKLCPVMSKGLDEIFCCESVCAWWNNEIEKCNLIMEGHLSALKLLRLEFRGNIK